MSQVRRQQKDNRTTSWPRRVRPSAKKGQRRQTKTKGQPAYAQGYGAPSWTIGPNEEGITEDRGRRKTSNVEGKERDEQQASKRAAASTDRKRSRIFKPSPRELEQGVFIVHKKSRTQRGLCWF